MDPATLAMLAKGAKYLPLATKGYQWLFGKGVPTRAGSMSSKESKYLNFLQSQAKTGLGQQVINQQLSATSRAAHQGVDIAKANIMGGGIAGGIEGSGVIAEQGVQADSAATLAMANAARSISEKNRQVKERAERQLGQYGMRDTDQRYREALANRAKKDSLGQEIIGGIAGMGSDYLGGIEFKDRQEADRKIRNSKKSSWKSSNLKPEA